MQTILTIFFLILLSAAMSSLGLFILNVAGLPGALVAGKPGVRSKAQLSIGIIISAIGQSYVYLSYISFIISWTTYKISKGIGIKPIIWLFAFLAAYLPILKLRTSARIEDNQTGSYYRNPQVEALDITAYIALFAFFVFVFLPNIMNFFWSWVFYDIN